MKEITGAPALTITATAGETYKISYESSTAVDIYNDTQGSILVNETGEFTASSGVGEYLKIPDGGSYNGYRSVTAIGCIVYIKAEAAGDICVVEKEW